MGSGIDCTTDCIKDPGDVADYTQLCDPLVPGECVVSDCLPAASPSWAGRDVFTCQ